MLGSITVARRPVILILIPALAAVLACGTRPPGAQPPGSAGVPDLPTRSLTPPIFYVDTTPFLGDGGAAGIRVTISIPYNQLHFGKRADGGFEASFDVVAVFYDRKHRQAGGDIWRHEVLADNYDDTISQKKTFASTKEFLLSEGEYTLEVRVSSVGMESGSSASRRVVVGPPVAEALAVSALEIGTCPDSLPAGGVAGPEAPGFAPSLTRRFGDPLPWVCARGEVFARSAGMGQGLTLRLKVIGFRDHVEAEEVFSLAAQGERSRFAVGVPVRPLGPGMYKLEVVAERGNERASAARTFEIDASRIDVERNFDDYVELARYYLGDEEIDPLRDVPESERGARWAAFWKDHDPDPDTAENEKLEEFLARVRTAADAYSAAGQPGWRTDRGKVYIRYGEPDDVEKVPQGFNSPAYEIWRYVSRNLTFVFADSSGFGDYVLVQPAGARF